MASIEMDWKTGALLTQFFQEEQVGHTIFNTVGVGVG